MLTRMNLIDIDSGDVETRVVFVDDNFIDKIEPTQKAWDAFWNGGDGYETYDEFVEDNEEDEIVKKNFDTFLEVGLDGWNLDVFITLLDAIYPTAMIKEVEVDKEFNFEY